MILFLFGVAVGAFVMLLALARGLFVARPEWPGADMIYAVTNSNVAGAAIGGQLKAAGLRRGFPDIAIDVARTLAAGGGVGAARIEYHGARIELKLPQGVLSDVGAHQTHWHERLNAQGYLTVVCFGQAEAWRFTCRYLGWGGEKQWA